MEQNETTNAKTFYPVEFIQDITGWTKEETEEEYQEWMRETKTTCFNCGSVKFHEHFSLCDDCYIKSINK